MILNDISILNTLASEAFRNNEVMIYPPIQVDTKTSGVDKTGQRICMISKDMHLGQGIGGDLGINIMKSLVRDPVILDKINVYAKFMKASNFNPMLGIGNIKKLIRNVHAEIFDYANADIFIAMSGPEFSFRTVGGVSEVTMQGQFVRNDKSAFDPYLVLSTSRLDGTALQFNAEGVGIYIQLWNDIKSLKRNSYFDLNKKYT